jgi:four helix bundle protein
MKYDRFEQLPCWEKARELSRAILEMINQDGFKKDFVLRNQLWKAAGSSMDNIAEGFDDGSTQEFIRFLGYSQRSCSEIQSQLYRALDSGYLDQAQFERTYELASECRKQIKGFRGYLRQCNRAPKASTPDALNP